MILCCEFVNVKFRSHFTTTFMKTELDGIVRSNNVTIYTLKSFKGSRLFIRRVNYFIEN